MTKRLLLTGASGFVAGSVVCQAGEDWEAHALSRKPSLPGAPMTTHWHVLDVLDHTQLQQAFEQIRPAAVIHIAAVADVDWCEVHPQEAHRINVDLTRAVAHLCRSTGARLVYTSTDTIFAGDKGPYTETDAAEPVNVYGQTKLLAEHAICDAADNWAIARLAIVMGLPFLGGGNSFLSRLMDVLSSGREAPVAVEEIRTPVDVVTVGRALLELAGNDFRGTIHLAGNDRLHRLDFSRQIAERLGYPPERVVPVQAATMTARARRPIDVSLDNRKARSTLSTPMLSLRDGLELVLAGTPIARGRQAT